jgi:hypothetical protein
MKRFAVRSALAAFFLLSIAGAAIAQNQANKTVEGKVLGGDNAPLSGAIVYLQDSKTSGIRSFISTADGSYRFGQVSSDIDYQIWAQYKNAKSGTKTISSFDSRKQVNIELKIKN